MRRAGMRLSSRETLGRGGRRWPGLWLVFVLVLVAAPVGAAGSVAVDMTELDDMTYDRIDGLKLHERLVLRLVQEGFAVVDKGAELVVTLSGDAEALQVVVRSGDAQSQRTVMFGTTPPAEVQLELIQKVVMLVRALSPAAAQTVEPATTEPESASPNGSSERDASDESDGWRQVPERWVQLDVGAGVMVRGGGADLMMRLGARFAVLRDWGVLADLNISPSGADALTVLEWSLLGGLSYRVPLASLLTLDVGAQLGPLFHHYSFSRGSGNDTGLAVDFNAALPVTMTIWPVPVLGVMLRATPGITSASREHRDQQGVLWSRGLLRGVFGAGIALQF